MNIQSTLSGDSLIDVAIRRIREHEPLDGYVVKFSGGKDSTVVLDLVKRAGVSYVVQFNPTGVDPPEIHIREHNLPYCTLYDEGKRRIGCIMCPMQGENGMRADAARYPKYYNAYIKAVQYCIDNKTGICVGGAHGNTAEEIMEWWITGIKKCGGGV